MDYWRTPLNISDFTVPRGEIRVLRDRCKGCGFCVEYCPRHVLDMSLEYNVKGYHPPEVRRPAECVDCKLCEMLCPEFAIWCVSMGEVRLEG